MKKDNCMISSGGGGTLYPAQFRFLKKAQWVFLFPWGKAHSMNSYGVINGLYTPRNNRHKYGGEFMLKKRFI